MSEPGGGEGGQRLLVPKKSIQITLSAIKLSNTCAAAKDQVNIR